jgi:hypothetical protein
MHMKTPLINFVCFLFFLAANESIAQITISQPTASTPITACVNYTLRYHATGSFSTYVVAEVHQNNSSGAIVKTYSNVSSGYLSGDYDNSVSSTGLSPGNYQIKIYDYYNPSFYGWSDIFTISPLAAPPSVSLLQNFGTYFEFNWTCNVTGVYEWRVDVATTSDFQSGTILSSYNDYHATGSECSGFYVNGIDNASTPYYARVRAVNGCSISDYSPTLAVICTTPSAPTATAATNITPTSFVTQWNGVPGAWQYTVTVTPAGGSPQTFTANGTSYTYTGAQPVSNYSYTVKAFSCTSSAESNSISVHTTLGVPVFGQGSKSKHELNITWSSVAGATYYHLQVSQDLNFASPLWDEWEGTETYAVIDAEWCDELNFRVRAKTASGEYGPFSPILTWPGGAGCSGARLAAQQVITGIEEEIQDENTLSSYPNPAENSVRIRLPKRVKANELSITVSDLSGHELQLSAQPFDGGFELDTSNAAKGIYFVSINAGTERLHSKFIKK